MATATVMMGPSVTTTTTTISPTPVGAGRSARRKQRCWIFRVDGIASDVSEVDLLASVRERYTTVKRLVVRSASSPTGLAGFAGEQPQQQVHPAAVDKNVLVEVQFTGPQPSEGPGALLCDLLCGSSVEAKPVELPRGRKKRARTDAASSEASDSDVEDGGSRKMSGHRSTNSLQQVGEEEEEEESPGGGRCIAAKPIFNGQGGSPMNRVKDDPGAVRRSSGRDSGGPVAASSGLAPLSSIGLFKTSPKSKSPSISCVVVPADPRAMPGLMPPQLRVVSLDTAQQQQQAPQQQQQQAPQQQQQQAPQQQHAPQQQQHHLLAMQHPPTQILQQAKVGSAGTGGGGAQWDDVVGRMTTPQGSSHSLDMGPVDLSASSSGGGHHPAVKSEYERLLVSTNSAGTWGSNDSQSALFGPMPPPEPVQPPLRGWSFDSSHAGDNTGGGGDFSSGNMVMDLSDVDNLFRTTEAEGKASATGAGSHDSAGSAGSSADAGAGGKQQEQGGLGGVPSASQGQKWATSEDMLSMEKVVIEPSRKECDFEGRPLPTSSGATSQRSGVVASPTNGQCHLVFAGLDKTGHDLRSLRVTAHFGVDSVHKVGKVTSPMKMGANGSACAAVFYPSMQEIWPELYSTGNIRVVEVDLVVEIRSDIEEYQYVGPQLKVTYLRTPPVAGMAAEVAGTEPPLQGRRIASRAPIPFPDDTSPQISYSCVDYSCGDWFSDMCQSVFRGGVTTHQPLHDDPSDLMSVDS